MNCQWNRINFKNVLMPYRESVAGALGREFRPHTRDGQHDRELSEEKIRAFMAEVGISSYTFVSMGKVSQHKLVARLSDS